MFSGALSIFFFAAFAARIGHACMAMQPNPRPTTTTTGAPETTTTSIATTTTFPETTTPSSTSSTTSTTTSTTTTTTLAPLSCKSCTAPKYMAPMTCNAGLICNEENLLTRLQEPCVSATCAMGSTLIGVQAGMPEVAISAKGIKCKPDGVSFEDAGDPTKVFPAATATFYCKKLKCMIPSSNAMCTPENVNVDMTCAFVMTKDNTLDCGATRSLYIDDVMQVSTKTCKDSGAWNNGVFDLTDGFTAYCK